MWRLATNSLAARPVRTLLLVLAVAMACTLTVIVAAATGTLQRSIRSVLGQMVGLSDLTLEHRFGGRLEQPLLELVRSWPQVQVATAQLDVALTLKCVRTGQSTTTLVQGIQPAYHQTLHPVNMLEGRMVQADDEIVLDRRIQEKLQTQLGDRLDVIRFGSPVSLTVVGVTERPPLAVLQQPMGSIMLQQAQALSGMTNLIDQISLQVHEGLDTAGLQELWQKQLPSTAQFQTPASNSVNVRKMLISSRLLLLLISVLVFMSAGFIVLTSLSTMVLQRMRELAILRCIGTPRWMMAGAQFAAGAMVSLAGCVIGVPLGLAISYGLYLQHRDALRGGFDPNVSGVTWAVVAALLTGLAGAGYPAVLAASVQPLQALTLRAQRVSSLRLWLLLVLGLLSAATAPVVVSLHLDPTATFWFYASSGLPLAFAGYFMLGVPVLIGLTWLLSPVFSRVLGLPGMLLRQTLMATPLRHGFTAGALMVGMAMLVGVWTGSRSVLGDWFNRIEMPDAYAHSFFAMSQQQWEALRSLPAVTRACPTTMFAVELADVQFGVTGLAPKNTQFVSFEPEAFFDMADLTWIQGDQATALRRLRQGQAVLVSREYLAAHGLGVGASLQLQTLQGPVDFEIAGVVASTGLDIAVHFFGIQRAFSEQSISAVFGTREDAQKYFGVDATNLVLLSLREDVSDKEFFNQARSQVPGVLVGSARIIRQEVDEATGKMLAVASTLAGGTLAIACLGVGNLIMASIAARRFEYGVLRAIGCSRGTIGRLLAAEVVLIALTAVITGTALGIQLSLVGRVFHIRMVGLVYDAQIPWDVIGIGTVVLIGAALLAALGPLVQLVRTPPRELLTLQHVG